MSGHRREPPGWVPDDFVPPGRVPVPFGHHLRPVRVADLALDLAALQGSRGRLWSGLGPPGTGRSAGPTLEQARAALSRHEEEMRALRSFAYVLLDTDETAVLGRVHLEPSTEAGADVDVTWWVVDECLGTEVATALAELVPRWVAVSWPWEHPRFRPPLALIRPEC